MLCMIELGQLEEKHQDFASRKVRLIVTSLEDPKAAAETQKEFPHLLVLADKERGLADAMNVIHERSAPDGSDTSAPTTLLVDGKGNVRWTYRPARFFTRLSPEDLLKAIDKHLK